MEMIKKEIMLELETVYGGDGFTYIDKIEEVLLNQSRKTVTIRRDIGIPITSVKQERKTKKVDVGVNTFKRDKDGNNLLRLGGTHGKFWGALKRSGLMMYEYGEITKADVLRIMEKIVVEPEWIKLEMNGCKMEREQLPQILNTHSYETTQIIMHYDVIPKCTVTFAIKYPKIYEKQIEQMIEYLPTVTHFNKRKTKITFIS